VTTPRSTPPDADGNASSERLIESGHSLEDSGDIEGALAKYQEAAATSPTFPRAYLNVSNALQRLGRTAEAVATLEAALRIDATCAPCHFNLGNIYVGTGNTAAAETAFREALRLAPDMSDAAIALANLLDSLRRTAEAEELLRRVLADAPACVPAAYNLGLLLAARDDYDEAEALFRACQNRDPSFLMVGRALGDLYRNTGRAPEADACYRKVLAANPSSQETWSGLLLSLNNRDDVTAAELFAEHLRFGAEFPEPAATRSARKRRTQRHARLRVGYLSGDFIQHPVSIFLRPVLAHHDHSQFESFCYSNNAKADGMTQDIRSRADHWRNIAGVDDTAAAQRIRTDELDVLIDLSGHSARSRILLFNHGCAPVQATWLGYLNTTGLASTDFRICDQHSDPAGMTEQFHTERLLRLPDSQWCYWPVFEVPRVPIPRRDPQGRVVFGSFNHLSKISDRCIDLWCRVLASVPASTLRIYAVPKGSATAALRGRFARHGIAGDRLDIYPRMDILAYFAAIGDVDIALDTLPYAGGTTTFDVLWMEVPMVALGGVHSASRSGVSILNTLQLPDLIARDDDDYVAINRRLAADGDRRRALRETLRARMLASPLMDAVRFTRNFESGIRHMLAEPQLP